MSLAQKIHKSYHPVTAQSIDFFRRVQRHPLNLPQTGRSHEYGDRLHPLNVPQTGRSHEYGDRLHRAEMDYPHVELLVIGDTADGRSIL